MGHAFLFKECEKYGDRVVVGINGDGFVLQYKGKLPAYMFLERQDIIAALGYETRLNSSPGRALIEEVKPDVLAIGSDWARKDYYAQIDVDQDFMDERRIAMLYIPRVGTLSSTELKARSAN